MKVKAGKGKTDKKGGKDEKSLKATKEVISQCHVAVAWSLSYLSTYFAEVSLMVSLQAWQTGRRLLTMMNFHIACFWCRLESKMPRPVTDSRVYCCCYYHYYHTSPPAPPAYYLLIISFFSFNQTFSQFLQVRSDFCKPDLLH